VSQRKVALTESIVGIHFTKYFVHVAHDNKETQTFLNIGETEGESIVPFSEEHESDVVMFVTSAMQSIVDPDSGWKKTSEGTVIFRNNCSAVTAQANILAPILQSLTPKPEMVVCPMGPQGFLYLDTN
jgi:hypothetical protein